MFTSLQEQEPVSAKQDISGEEENKPENNKMSKQVPSQKLTRFIIDIREYSTYTVVTTSRPKAPRHMVVHDNLKTFTKYL